MSTLPTRTDFGRLVPAFRVALTGDGLDAWREAMASTIDWNAMLRAAHAERVAPLLAHALTRSGRDGSSAIPPGVHDALRHAYLAGAGRAAILGDAAAQLLSTFAHAGIPVIALKGLELAETVSPNPALRPMEDLDLLVRPGDIAAAARVLTEAGYREAWHGYPDLQRVDGLVDVDLHTALLHEGGDPHAARSPSDRKRDRLDGGAAGGTGRGAGAGPLPAAPTPAPLPAPVPGPRPLRPPAAADILALGARYPDLLTLDSLRPIAATRAVRRALFCGSNSYEGCLGVVLPVGLLDALRPTDLTRLERRLVVRARSGAIPSAARYYFTLRSLPARRQRLRLVREMARAWYRRRCSRPFGNSP